jgi:hypothetical protein
MEVSLNVKLAGHVKKRCINVKEISISKSIRHHGYVSYFKTVMIKRAEETNKCDMRRKDYIPPQQQKTEGGNDTNQNLPVLCEN